jgi:hypothetical protein
MNLRDLTPPADLPAADARMPGAAPRIALAIVGTLLSCVVFSTGGWIGVGIAISVIAALAPELMIGWLLILFLALGELGRPATLRWQLFVLLAGVNLLHLLATLALELPWRGWVQPAVFRAPLLRFVAIQIPSQLVAVVATALLAPNANGHRPVTIVAFTVIGAAALGGLALLLLRPSSRR